MTDDCWCDFPECGRRNEQPDLTCRLCGEPIHVDGGGVVTHRDGPGSHDPEVMEMKAHPRHLRPHATFGDDPSGWCGCAGCDPQSDCGCSSCRHAFRPDDVETVVLTVKELSEYMAQAWDEGYRLDWTGGAKWDNPYRPGGGPAL